MAAAVRARGCCSTSVGCWPSTTNAAASACAG